MSVLYRQGLKMKKILLLLAIPFHLYAVSHIDYIDTSKCDQIIDKKFYNICYSYENKGALGGWVTLKGDLVNQNSIKKRLRFSDEKDIPSKYRTHYKDYTGYGKEWNRGHFIVADADFDYDIRVLSTAYSMANIIPQSANVNQKTWIKVEKYGRLLASKLGYINSVSIARYDNPNAEFKSGIKIPTRLYRIYYNNEHNFERCFMYENKLHIDYKKDKLKDHEIDCREIKRK